MPRKIKRWNERERNAGTFHQFAASDAASIEGRFKQVSQSVIGSEPTPTYSTLPASSPWSQPDPGGPEFLGYSVDQMEPTGEVFEIEKSLRETCSDAASSPPAPECASPSGGAEAPAPGAIPEPSETAPPPSPKRRKRR